MVKVSDLGATFICLRVPAKIGIHPKEVLGVNLRPVEVSLRDMAATALRRKKRFACCTIAATRYLPESY